ncbi:peptidase [Vibrio sp. V34_P3A8T189]|uniref:phage protease n=1 Tax=unclassified Vibrio TaxID=2614977 RepID=UPI0013735256|nr:MULTISPECIES: phage protease [unclassified Vibrio]NAX01444.1 peptidase [Vibrio sp. V34_P3A8T189]NAX07201.1 peptidase [Vibrio sp. V40_P2S30T141]
MANCLTALCFKMESVDADASGVWLPLIPAGTFQGNDGRTWHNSNPEEIIQRFTKIRPFDVEHATHIKGPKGEPAPAYGWITKLENRNGEIWGFTEWNTEGREMIEEKKYAFYSPAFGHDKESGFVYTVESAGLTNEPNLNVPALNRQEENEMKLSPIVVAALGLTESATEQDAVTAINSLKSEKDIALNRASNIDLSVAVPKETYQLALNRAETAEAALKEIRESEIDALVDGAIKVGKVAPANRDMYVGLCRAEGGIEQFKKFVETAPAIATNSNVTTSPDSVQADELDPEEIALCRKMGVTQEEYLKSKQSLAKGA